ncbi:MAG: patatin-like phospholipase family protein [Clostridium sp.]|nr:patatin-like phospholipase family protein [Prevotella sp.]MCM1428725.1 patatin-like phospholipase family protein [Clostridium sp.]MCM1475100.1 patatin-like phospholipase family protein [Muribaculaceae bacterium]
MFWRIDGLLEKIGLVEKPLVGLALSGGGAKGFSHIGVLMAFESFGLKPGVLSGVSAGSIAAVLYAAGLSPADIIECFSETNKFGDFTEFIIPKSGIFRLDKFGTLLDSWLPVKDLSELTIPTVVCATDFDRGRSVGWSKGEIVPRVLASCSIPVVFPPVHINGVHYVDGGVLRNLPAWAIRDYCKTLYGVNCSPLKPDYKYKSSILDIAYRSYQLMAKSNTLQDIHLCDHVISLPQVSNVGIFALRALRDVVNTGYDTACRVLEKSLK